VPGSGFGEALDDDLNISAALGFLFETLRTTNRRMDDGTLPAGEAAGWLAWLDLIDAVLAIKPGEGGVPEPVTALLREREAARAAKNWALSDSLRDRILQEGWIVKDTKTGQKTSPAP
jgi:cysteinyl-tRNA synthetase